MAGHKVICVGGSSGMGKGCAKAVVRAGGSVLLCSRSADKLASARAEIAGGDREALGRIDVRVLDTASEADVQALFESLPTGEYDGLVVSALGGAVHGSFLELDIEQARKQMEDKFWGPYRCAKYGAKALRDGGGIVFVSGILAKRPGKNCSSLAAANAAVEGLTRALALELGPRLRVNCLSPGFVDTERFDRMEPSKKQAMLESVAVSLPLKAVGDAEDVGEALYFLATNKFTTGVTLDCDGGHSLRQYALPNALYSELKEQGKALDF